MNPVKNLSTARALSFCAAAIIVLVQACAPALYDVYQRRPPSFDTSTIKRLAVLPFQNFSSYNGAGELIVDQLTERLARTEQYEIIERSNLEAIFAEQKLGQSGAIDEGTAVQAGKLKGADAIITGKVIVCSVNSFNSGGTAGDQYQAVKVTTNAVVTASIRVLSTETGTLLWSENSSKTVTNQGQISNKQKTAGTQGLAGAISDLTLVLADKKPRDPQLVLQDAVTEVVDDLFWDLINHRSQLRLPANQLKPGLGVNLQDLSPEQLRRTGHGVLVSKIWPQSPAGQQGMREGDIILSIDDYAVDKADQLVSAIRNKRAFQTIKLKILRPGANEVINKKIKLGYLSEI